VLIEKVPPSTGRVDCTCKPPGSSRCRCEHRQQHRYRCAACKQTFCDSCLATPYHEGLDCEEAAAPHCQLCDVLVLEAVELQTAGLSTKQLRVEATALGMDCSWCLERSELVEAYKRAKQVGIDDCITPQRHCTQVLATRTETAATAAALLAVALQCTFRTLITQTAGRFCLNMHERYMMTIRGRMELKQCLLMAASLAEAEPDRLPCCVDTDMPGVSAKVEADVQQAAALPPLVLRGAGKQQLPALPAGRL